MKKKNLKSLNLNKQLISHLKQAKITGGKTATVTCATSCRIVEDSHHWAAHPREAIQAFHSAATCESIVEHLTCHRC